MLDAGQIVDDLIPISRQDADVLIGDIGSGMRDAGYEIGDMGSEMCDMGYLIWACRGGSLPKAAFYGVPAPFLTRRGIGGSSGDDASR